ncbi:probable E3 ubiquitin-protein ligase MARCHF10 isoform X5 [Vicugna pacos]|uniref:RING-type E3 ubiquitin transferase n=1 Tax=Vicugna pacos TaxID=30538 RepID=A0ABM5BGE7_VICPA
MLHEAKDRQKFVSDVQYLRDMQHKVDSEYQACLRRQEYRRDPNEKKRDRFGGQETNFERSRFSSGSSSKQRPPCDPTMPASFISHLSSPHPWLRPQASLPEDDATFATPSISWLVCCLQPKPVPTDPSDTRKHHLLHEASLDFSPFSSSGEEDPLAEPRLSTKNSACKSDSRLPAIDQTSVKQKHKSTMTPKKSEKAGPSKPSPAAQAPQILSRKKRPDLGRLTVSPDLQSPRACRDRSRQMPRLPGKALALRGADPVVQQEGPIWTSDTKMKRPTRERRSLVSSSQLVTVTEKTPERAKKGNLSALAQNEPHPALSQGFQGTSGSQLLSESLGPPLISTNLGGPRRTTFQFRDEDFYSVLSLNPRGENDDTEEETHTEEELLLAVSEFPNQNDTGSRMEVSGFTDEKEATKIKADPEKLKKLQESLLQEDSAEEGDWCRICQIAGGSPTNPLLEPCGCVGSLQFVHLECLKQWLKVKITSGADLSTVKTCEMCKQDLLVDLDDFNMTEFYQKHQQSRAQHELMNTGLYLVLLLRLYQRRFAELMRLNDNRAARERLSRNYPQPRPEENESSELGDGNESSICESNRRVV